MTWLGAAVRVFIACAIATGVGWIYGYPLQALTGMLALVVLFWLYQMQRVQSWLREPQEAPPDAFGIWGDLVGGIYIHQRKGREVQEQLQGNIEYLQDSFASMRDGVVMVDEYGGIKWLNEAVEPLLGLRYPDDTGYKLTNLVRTPEFNEYFLGGDYGTPLQYRMTGDKPRHLRVEITYFGEGDRLLFIRDISESVRMEQMRRDFVANVSHELRTPLTVISGYLGTFMAAADDLPPRYEKPLQQMSQQAERMETLLKDLLWLSRIEHEQDQSRMELVDMAGLLQELREEFIASYPEREFRFDLSPDLRVLGDYRELYSAVSNLGNNAVKYSPDGSPVTFRAYQARNSCIVEVEDRGIGIDSRHIPRLTERFYRVDDSRSSQTGGTGLGLAIVKHVLAAHQGELEIDSTLSRGSTFRLIFPLGGKNPC